MIVNNSDSLIRVLGSKSKYDDFDVVFDEEIHPHEGKGIDFNLIDGFEVSFPKNQKPIPNYLSCFSNHDLKKEIDFRKSLGVWKE